MMTKNGTQFDWIFGLQWLATCAVGLIAGGMLAFASIWAVGEAVEKAAGETAAYIAVGSLFGAIIGLSASIGPGLLLQSRGIPAFRWILASVVFSAIGMAIGVALVFIFMDLESMSEAATGVVIGIFLGLPLGSGQWLVLRPHGLLGGEWVLISSLAFVIGMTIGLPLGGEGREWLALGVIGLLVGAITGLGIVWLFRRQAIMALRQPF
jgi:hypothetical protein